MLRLRRTLAQVSTALVLLWAVAAAQNVTSGDPLLDPGKSHGGFGMRSRYQDDQQPSPSQRSGAYEEAYDMTERKSEYHEDKDYVSKGPHRVYAEPHQQYLRIAYEVPKKSGESSSDHSSERRPIFHDIALDSAYLALKKEEEGHPPESKDGKIAVVIKQLGHSATGHADGHLNKGRERHGYLLLPIVSTNKASEGDSSFASHQEGKISKQDGQHAYEQLKRTVYYPEVSKQDLLHEVGEEDYQLSDDKYHQAGYPPSGIKLAAGYQERIKSPAVFHSHDEHTKNGHYYLEEKNQEGYGDGSPVLVHHKTYEIEHKEIPVVSHKSYLIQNKDIPDVSHKNYEFQGKGISLVPHKSYEFQSKGVSLVPHKSYEFKGTPVVPQKDYQFENKGISLVPHKSYEFKGTPVVSQKDYEFENKGISLVPNHESYEFKGTPVVPQKDYGFENKGISLVSHKNYKFIGTPVVAQKGNEYENKDISMVYHKSYEFKGTTVVPQKDYEFENKGIPFVPYKSFEIKGTPVVPPKDYEFENKGIPVVPYKSFEIKGTPVVPQKDYEFENKGIPVVPYKSFEIKGTPLVPQKDYEFENKGIPVVPYKSFEIKGTPVVPQKDYEFENKGIPVVPYKSYEIKDTPVAIPKSFEFKVIPVFSHKGYAFESKGVPLAPHKTYEIVNKDIPAVSHKGYDVLHKDISAISHNNYEVLHQDIPVVSHKSFEVLHKDIPVVSHKSYELQIKDIPAVSHKGFELLNKDFPEGSYKGYEQLNKDVHGAPHESYEFKGTPLAAHKSYEFKDTPLASIKTYDAKDLSGGDYIFSTHHEIPQNQESTLSLEPKHGRVYKNPIIIQSRRKKAPAKSKQRPRISLSPSGFGGFSHPIIVASAPRGKARHGIGHRYPKISIGSHAPKDYGQHGQTTPSIHHSDLDSLRPPKALLSHLLKKESKHQSRFKPAGDFRSHSNNFKGGDFSQKEFGSLLDHSTSEVLYDFHTYPGPVYSSLDDFYRKSYGYFF